MNEQVADPRDALLFLVSRGLDEPLSPHQQKRLDDGLSHDEALRAQAAQLQRAARLVNRWAVPPVELDWEQHARLIDARVAEPAGEESHASVDRLLQRWALREAKLDDEGVFAPSVLARLEAAQRGAGRRATRTLLFRIGAPLAAAAAIVLAVTAGWRFRTDADSTCEVRYATPVSFVADSTDAPSAGRIDVSFGRNSIVPGVQSAPSPAVSFVSVGSSETGDPNVDGFTG